MKKVAVVYRSGCGHTERQAKSVAEGAAAVAGVTAQQVCVAEAALRYSRDGSLRAAADNPAY